MNNATTDRKGKQTTGNWYTSSSKQVIEQPRKNQSRAGLHNLLHMFFEFVISSLSPPCTFHIVAAGTRQLLVHFWIWGATADARFSVLNESGVIM